MCANTLIKIIASIFLIIITGSRLPWWSFSIITLLVGYTTKSSKQSLVIGFIIGFLSWFIVLIYSFYNGGYIIFSKMSLILNLNTPSLLIILSSLLSGLIGLLTSYIGYQFNKNNFKENDNYN